MSGIHLNNNPFGKSGIVSKKDEHFVKNLHSKEKEEMHHAKSGSSFPPEKQESKGRCVIKKKETRELLVETLIEKILLMDSEQLQEFILQSWSILFPQAEAIKKHLPLLMS